jgi:hypothetical protein
MKPELLELLLRERVRTSNQKGVTARRAAGGDRQSAFSPAWRTTSPHFEISRLM